jgi:hypothetical protein
MTGGSQRALDLVNSKGAYPLRFIATRIVFLRRRGMINGSRPHGRRQLGMAPT